MTLVEFLRARLDEAEQVARDCAGPHLCGCAHVDFVMFAGTCDCGYPARVLADVEVKRKIIAEFQWWIDGQDAPPRSDAELHASFAHPAYEYRTTEGQRKAFDDASVPPSDDNGEPDYTWERNTDAGRGGWERFDYTEESYWRRRLPEDQVSKAEPPLILRLLALPYADHADYDESWRP